MMWLIGLIVCAAVMLAGHSSMDKGHASRSNEPAPAARPVPTEALRDGATAEGAGERAPQPSASGPHH